MALKREPQPDIDVHIDEIVLHGLGAVDVDAVRGAVQRELARRLAASGLTPGSSAKIRIDRAATEDIRIGTGRHGSPIGAELGRALGTRLSLSPGQGEGASGRPTSSRAGDE